VDKSLKKVGQGVLELLIGNKTVTKGWKDQLTYAKQYALSSLKGSIIKDDLIGFEQITFCNFNFLRTCMYPISYLNWF